MAEEIKHEHGLVLHALRDAAAAKPVALFVQSEMAVAAGAAGLVAAARGRVLGIAGEPHRLFDQEAYVAGKAAAVIDAVRFAIVVARDEIVFRAFGWHGWSPCDWRMRGWLESRRARVARAFEKGREADARTAPLLLLLLLRRGALRPPAFLPSCGDAGVYPRCREWGPGFWAHHPSGDTVSPPTRRRRPPPIPGAHQGSREDGEGIMGRGARGVDRKDYESIRESRRRKDRGEDFSPTSRQRILSRR